MAAGHERGRRGTRRRPSVTGVTDYQRRLRLTTQELKAVLHAMTSVTAGEADDWDEDDYAALERAEVKVPRYPAPPQHQTSKGRQTPQWPERLTRYSNT